MSQLRKEMDRNSQLGVCTPEPEAGWGGGSRLEPATALTFEVTLCFDLGFLAGQEEKAKVWGLILVFKRVKMIITKSICS